MDAGEKGRDGVSREDYLPGSEGAGTGGYKEPRGYLGVDSNDSPAANIFTDSCEG